MEDSGQLKFPDASRTLRNLPIPWCKICVAKNELKYGNILNFGFESGGFSSEIPTSQPPRSWYRTELLPQMFNMTTVQTPVSLHFLYVERESCWILLKTEKSGSHAKMAILDFSGFSLTLVFSDKMWLMRRVILPLIDKI